MANPYFKFKQFTVWHDRCAMKVGTDGVLLGAWSDVTNACRILDIGTGTGLVALMLAQRSVAHITALEIDKEAVSQAKENICSSPWKERIHVEHQDFRDYTPETKFDLIVSNPPYFVDSLVCPGEQRTMARHNSSLGYHDLLEGVARMLTTDGKFCVIIPSDAVEDMVDIAKHVSLYPSKRMDIITSPGKSSKRALIEFVLNSDRVCEISQLLIEEKRHQYSPEYILLTRDYYLNL